MLLEYDGVKFRHLDLEDMNYAEIAIVERNTGMSQGKLRAAGQECLCGHRILLHMPENEGDPQACKAPDCECDEPMQDLSIEVAQALMHISLKRVRPEITFSQVGQIGVSDFTVVPEGDVEPDPTSGVDLPSETPEASSETPVLPVPSEPSTSEPSPTS